MTSVLRLHTPLMKPSHVRYLTSDARNMLEWLTGSTRTADAQDAPKDDEVSYVEEPPETPAPLFAVRAFKTALFGTPHPDQSDVKRQTQAVEQQPIVAKTRPAEKAEVVQAHDAVNHHLDEPVAVSKVDILASPAKGILLTPGTGPTRRKTVSFGTLLADAQKKEEQSLSLEANRDSPLKSRKDPGIPEASPKIQPRHSSLTKTLIQLSKQKSNNQATSITSSEDGPTTGPASSVGIQTENTDQLADNTVDLSQPCSRSGQHWKTEYEQYHKRSNREMKKIIMYGQNVKSYAAKKDSEATGLGEKLKKELVKVAAMEKKVSKLAAQLNNAYAHSPEGESEQTRLVSELAHQTALAIRYKQKADHYRRAMQKQNHADSSDGERGDIQAMKDAFQGSNRETGSPEAVAQSADKGMLDAQIESLRASARKAEDQAAKLEAENSALKQSLARVKGEMMSYEARRQAREERYKRREAKCKADQKACEAQLAKLTAEHRILLLASRQPSEAEALARPQSTARYDDLRGLDGNRKSLEGDPVSGNQTIRESLGQKRVSKPYISPRKSRLQKSAVDIWTLSSPRDAGNSASPSKEPTELPPSSVRHDIQRTLKEIDRNLIPEQHPGTGPNPEPHPSKTKKPHKPPTHTIPQPQPDPSSPFHPTYSRNPTTISPPRPAKLEPSEAIVEPAVKSSVAATFGRSSSLMSRVGSRTGTMTSGRGSALSNERAAAAKARLAARSAEKRRGRSGE